MPILDGSAASFVFLLQSAGIELQAAPKRFMRISRPIEVREGSGPTLKWARLEPYHGFKLSFEIDFHHPAVDQTGQRVEFDMGSGRYKRDIARARTFGFTKDVEMMRTRGLALGGGMDNAIVVDDYRVLNAEGLRYDDEFVKHKILDAIGDLYMHRQAAARVVQRVQERPCAEQQAAAHGACRRAPTTRSSASKTKRALHRASPNSRPHGDIRRTGRPCRFSPRLRPVGGRERAVLRDVHRHGPGRLAPARARHHQMDGARGLAFFAVLLLENLAGAP